MRCCGLALCIGLLLVAFANETHAQDVDLLLVLAVDASGSVTPARFELQRQGYADAFRSPRLIQAVGSGPNQAIAVTMFQWTGPTMQVLVVPWTRIGDAAAAQDFAARVAAGPRQLFGGGTAVGGAIDHAMRLLAAAPFTGVRRARRGGGRGRGDQRAADPGGRA